MAREYSNFLLFEDMLDAMPEDAAPVMKQAVNLLITPTITIIEEDCGTLLGNVQDLNFETEGLTELATGLPLSRTRISQLLSSGVYKTNISNLNSCNSSLKKINGVCRKCYAATTFETAPIIGTTISADSYTIYQTDVIIGDGYSKTYKLSQTEDDWFDVKVIKDGAVLPGTSYVLGSDTLSFAVAPTYSDVFVVHFFKFNTEPFEGYLSKTYSGGLLGIEPLPTIPMFLRQSVYQSYFNETMIGMMVDELNTIKSIPPSYMDYINRIHDKLEKILFIMLLYSLYKNMEL